MTHVNGVIAKLMSKGLMQFEFAHDLLWEYMQQATPVQMQVGYFSLVMVFVADRDVHRADTS